MTYRTKTVHLLVREELKNKSAASFRNHIPYPQRIKERSSRYLHSEYKSQRRTQITSLGWDEETMTARTEHKHQSHDFKLIPTLHKNLHPRLTIPREGSKSHHQSSRSGSPVSNRGKERSDLKPCTSLISEMLQIYRSNHQEHKPKQNCIHKDRIDEKERRRDRLWCWQSHRSRSPTSRTAGTCSRLLVFVIDISLILFWYLYKWILGWKGYHPGVKTIQLKC